MNIALAKRVNDLIFLRIFLYARESTHRLNKHAHFSCKSMQMYNQSAIGHILRCVNIPSQGGKNWFYLEGADRHGGTILECILCGGHYGMGQSV